MKYFFFLGSFILVLMTSSHSFAIGNIEKHYPQKNSITIKLTDSPANYAALYVEVLEVALYGEEQGWITVSNQSQYINVLALTNGTELELAQIFASEDIYTRMMIRFGHQNNIYFYGDRIDENRVETISKTLGWKGNHDIYIPIYQEIPGDNASEIILDFNVAESINKEGNDYTLAPVVKVMENKSTGISGHIGGGSMVLIEVKNKNYSYSAFADMNGNFLIRGMEPGMYELEITPDFINYNGRPEGRKSTYQIAVESDEIRILDPAIF